MAFRLGFGFVPNPLTSMKWWGAPANLLDGYAPRMFLDFNSGKYEVQSAVSTLANSITVSNNSAIRTYIDKDGALQTAPANTPRIDWSFGFPRLLLEGAATNYVRNSVLAGAVLGVLGSGGALPTNIVMSAAVSGDLETSVVGIGTENGRPYVDVRFVGQHTTHRFLNLEAANVIPAVAGNTRTFSIYARVIAGSLDGMGSLDLFLAERNSAGSPLSPASNTSIKPTANSTARRLLSRTMTDPACANALPFIRLPAATAPIDFTMRISLPQVEAGALATSPILTSGTALTRTADLCSLHASAGAMTSWAWRGYVPSLSVYQHILGSSGGGYFISGSAGSEASIRLYGTNAGIGFNNVLPGTLAFCAGWGPSGRRVSNAGAVAVEDAVVPDRSRATMYIGPNTGLATGQVIYLDELVGYILPDRPSAAGVQSQARAAA